MLDTARVCERMREIFTLSTASTDAPSSTSTRTVSAFPQKLAHSKAVLPYSCEYSQVIRAERSIRLDEREHANQYIHTCACMRIYTQPQTSPMCVYVKEKKMPERESESDRALVFSSEKNNRALLARAFFYICMYIYIYI